MVAISMGILRTIVSPTRTTACQYSHATRNSGPMRILQVNRDLLHVYLLPNDTQCPVSLAPSIKTIQSEGRASCASLLPSMVSIS